MNFFKVLIAVAAFVAVAAAIAPPLPKVLVDPNTVTVSGISAGGFMAVQFQLAFSNTINGAAIVAGGPFLCASGGEGPAFECMYSPEMINVGQLVAQAQSAAQDGSIDSLANLAKQTVLMFSGTQDTIVNQGCMVALANMYKQLGVRADYTITQFSIAAEHSWVTSQYGNACNYLGSPYVNNCNYDAGGIFLNETFAIKFKQQLKPRGKFNAANLLTFDQTAFGAQPTQNSMGTTGFVYVPEKCKTTKCKLHINFHGCDQSKDQIGDTYVTQTQLNEWAEGNDIVILYPQITPTTDYPIINPEGCFDWWGYTGPTYAYKNGPQMEIVRKMMAQLAGQ